MNQYFIDGFIKRASQYGYTEDEAINIYKMAFDPATNPYRDLNSAMATLPDAPITGADINSRVMQGAQNVGNFVQQHYSPSAVGQDLGMIGKGIGSLFGHNPNPTPPSSLVPVTAARG